MWHWKTHHKLSVSDEQYSEEGKIVTEGFEFRAE